MEFSRTSLASKTYFEVLGLESSSSRKLPYSQLKDSTIFWIFKFVECLKIILKALFFGDYLKKNLKTFILFFLRRSPEKNFFFWDRLKKKNFEDLFFTWRTVGPVSFLGPWPWPQAFLSLTTIGLSVLGRAVLGLGLGFFCVLDLEPWVLDSTSEI